MREYVIDGKNAGQRLDKYLFKLMPGAPTSLIYKMLRKKNIVLNDKKSDGKDSLSDRDVIKVYMSDETIDKFSNKNSSESDNISAYDEAYKMMPDIVYEDENLIIINKPAGMLSQKAEDSDISCNEICISYMRHNSKDVAYIDDNFTPSICNRLDRNTSGVLIFAKNYISARKMAEGLKDRSIKKYYKCIVSGCVNDELDLSGRLTKNEKNNKVTITNLGEEGNISTSVKPLKSLKNMSMLEIHLITGKTHQIRAHLAAIGHFIIGDYKYGDRSINDIYKKKYGIKHQLLCAYKVVMPTFDGELEYLSNREFVIDEPEIFKRIIIDGNMEIKRS